VDPQEFYEHACGILRAFAEPNYWEAIATPFDQALAQYSNVRFVQGEVVDLQPGAARVAPALQGLAEIVVRFDFCVVATGCNTTPPAAVATSSNTTSGSPTDSRQRAADVSAETSHPQVALAETTTGSLAPKAPWQPSSIGVGISDKGAWPKVDERTMEGRRKYILEEHKRLKALEDTRGTVLVSGADYQGVEWATELQHYFPDLRVILIDRLPRCLGTLPASAAEYAERYLHSHGIHTFYGVEYAPSSEAFWNTLGLPAGADITYDMHRVYARNGFMPANTLALRGPSGGGWIVTNSRLQVCTRDSHDRPAHVWGGGRIFAVGDCHYGAVMARQGSGKADDSMGMFLIPPVPKTALAAVRWARVACRNVVALSRSWSLQDARWPPEAGLFAVSLGPSDGIVAWKVSCVRDSGEIVLVGEAASELKRRMTWPDNSDWLVDPSAWLVTLKEGIPAGRVLLESLKSWCCLPGRAW